MQRRGPHRPRLIRPARWEGTRLQALLDAHGVSTTHLAAELGVTEGAVRNWLRGSQPTVKSLFRMADRFGVSVESFYWRGE